MKENFFAMFSVAFAEESKALCGTRSFGSAAQDLDVTFFRREEERFAKYDNTHVQSSKGLQGLGLAEESQGFGVMATREQLKSVQKAKETVLHEERHNAEKRMDNNKLGAVIYKRGSSSS